MVSDRREINRPILPKVKVSTEGECAELFRVEVNGKELKTVKTLNISIGAGKVSTITMEFYASIEFIGKIYPVKE